MKSVFIEAREAVRGLGLGRPNSRAFRTAVVMLIGDGRRKHLSDLTALTGYPKPFVQDVLHRCRALGLWQGEDKDQASDWEGEGGLVRFLDDLQSVLAYDPA